MGRPPRDDAKARANAMALIKSLDDGEEPSEDITILDRKITTSQADRIWLLNQMRIVKMSVAGYTHQEIAAEVGLNIATVAKRLKKFMEKTAARIGVEDLRMRELLRYEVIGQKLWEKIDPADPEQPMSMAAIDKYMTVAAARRALMGLDAPVDKTVNHNISSTKAAERTANDLARFMDLADRLAEYGSGRIEIPGAIEARAIEAGSGSTTTTDGDTADLLAEDDYDDDHIEVDAPHGIV